MGVSALVRARDEEDWIEPSLRSLEGFADEIVVVDNGSTDRTLERARALVGRLAVDLRVHEAPGLDHAALSNDVLGRARFRWVIRWDADFVAHTTGPHALAGLRAVLDAVPPWRHVCLHPALVELAGDLFHQRPATRVRWDSHCLTWAPALRYQVATVRTAAARGRPRRLAVESLRLPLYYRIRRWETPAIFHVDVKPARRMLLRHFWQEWWAERPGLTLEEYARRRAAIEWGTPTLEVAAKEVVLRACRDLAPFDPAAWGGYPELLRPAVARPRYRILYERGAVVGRRDALAEEGAA
jgi:glycosyltransferase involved in cell wall biosynthesis